MADEKQKTDQILTRLRRIEGQIRGIQRMFEENRECEDVITQLMAARAGLDQVGLLILDSHVMHCVFDMLPEGDPKVRQLQRALKSLTRFGASGEEPAGA